MNRKYRTPFIFRACCAAALISLAPTAQTVVLAESASPDVLWPDLNALRSEAESESDTASGNVQTASQELAAPSGTPYTAEELEDLFGGMPVYFNCGSLTLNKLNNIPMAIPFWSNGSLVEKDGDYYLRRPWSELQSALESMLDGYEGDWSVYVKDLSGNHTITLNIHSMQSASLIKLYIAGATYELIEQGSLTETETITDALYNMITVSDNESSNVLVRAMCDESGDFQTGLTVVNDFISRYGFSDTAQVNGIADPSLWVSDGRVNSTSAEDCGKLLELVYRGELVSHFSSFRFEVLLNKQEVNYKIPAGLPEDVHISHKTGEDDDTENDAAIIYTPYGDYILCVMSTDLADTGTAVDHIHEITALVHAYFTEDLTPFGLSFANTADADSSVSYSIGASAEETEGRYAYAQDPDGTAAG